MRSWNRLPTAARLIVNINVIIRVCAMRLRNLLILLSCLLLFTACACAELPNVTTSSPPQLSTTSSPPPSPTLSFEATLLPVTPEALVAQLTATTALQATALQLAEVLQVPVTQIQARIRSKECLVCNLSVSGAESRPPLLSLAEAEAQLQANDLFWLSVQTLTCAYYFDGKTITPRSCQIE